MLRPEMTSRRRRHDSATDNIRPERQPRRCIPKSFTATHPLDGDPQKQGHENASDNDGQSERLAVRNSREWGAKKSEK